MSKSNVRNVSLYLVRNMLYGKIGIGFVSKDPLLKVLS